MKITFKTPKSIREIIDKLNFKKWSYQLLAVMAIGATAFTIKTYLFSFASINGKSMTPLLNSGDIVFVAKWNRHPRPGQIVVIDLPEEGAKVVKRLIAIGPAEIAIDNFKLFVNGNEFPESTHSPPAWDRQLFDCAFSPLFKIEKDELFFLGDNRCHSSDSRSLLRNYKSKIYGLTLLRLYPTLEWIY